MPTEGGDTRDLDIPGRRRPARLSQSKRSLEEASYEDAALDSVASSAHHTQQKASTSRAIETRGGANESIDLASVAVGINRPTSAPAAAESLEDTASNPLAQRKRRKADGERPFRISLPENPYTSSHRADLAGLNEPVSNLSGTAPRPSAGVLDLGTKRSLSGSDILPSKSAATKRQRLRQTGRGLHYHADPNVPPSPLFFSFSAAHPRPQFPPRFSSSEAAAKMLSSAQGEDASVKTVTLARGSYHGSSPPVSAATRSRASFERVNLALRPSTEIPENSEALSLLGNIGITELLDQDDRPVFIVDLADKANHTGPGFEPVFANVALISCGSLLDALTGKTYEDSSNPLVPKSQAQFKEWVLSASLNGEHFGLSLPAFVQGAMAWTASTLRKRFRVVSGTLTSDVTRRTSSVGQSTVTTHHSDLAPVVDLPKASLGSSGQGDEPVVLLRYHEAQDYFGNAARSYSGSPGGDSKTLRRDFQTFHPTPNTRSPADGSQLRTQTPLRASPATASQPASFESVLSASISEGDRESSMSPSGDIEIFDWTRIPNVETLPSHIRFARSIDWGATSLGPIETWEADLRQMVNLIMASPHPAAMYWGPDLVAIYNEAYVFLAGQKHPQLMGQSYREAWKEIWDDVKDVFASAQSTGQATMKDDDCLFIMRSEVLEETYFSWSIIPMVGSEGTVKGLYNPAFEKTRRKVAERRMLTLREVGERTATARDVRGFWAAVLAALAANEYDTPFVLLYSLAEDDSSESASVTDSSITGGARQCFLEGALGVPDDHPAAPLTMDLHAGNEGFAPLFREAMMTNQTKVLDMSKGEIPPELLDGLEWRGFGDPSRSIVICPIHPTTGENVLGFLVMGVNPRRPYDDDYNLYVQLLSRQLATSLASVVLFEEEIRRGRRAAKIAALDRIELSEQLAARTQEAIESETKFTRMAEFAPVGMFIANSIGKIVYCNDTWYDITAIPKGPDSHERWEHYINDEDKPIIKRMWDELFNDCKRVSAEIRFKTPWIDRNGVTGPTWALFSAMPEMHEDGATLKGVFGSITNISAQKWAEGVQKKKTDEAIELKRQQENFIDITSAILQCADEIVMSLTDAKSSIIPGKDTSPFESSIDAAQTIALCAQHQKRIVDDVLTMSKLDSALLIVTPVDVQPLAIIQRALRMFEGELSSADINMNFQVDPSYEELGIDWVLLDPSRVMQVLINLTTNAIKFTMNEKKRDITVTVAASTKRYSQNASAVVKYVPPRPPRYDVNSSADASEDNVIYLQFTVQDTGRGLSEEEKKSLFLRFSQASPRTHVQYGGSGLGLFISRELTELQGGEIGVASSAGEGSTFAFFVKARRTNAPDNAAEYQMPIGLGTVTRRASDGRIGGRRASAPKIRDFAAMELNREELKILLVEDNIVNQRVLQKQLIKLGCQVYVANHGQEALDKLEASRFSVTQTNSVDALDVRVVLMDQEMPVMDGITATRRIRELEAMGSIRWHVPILGITANARPEQIQQLLDAGMDDVVSKPFRIAEIMPKIQELTARFKRERASPKP